MSTVTHPTRATTLAWAVGLACAAGLACAVALGRAAGLVADPRATGEPAHGAPADPPRRLSETGLYADVRMTRISPQAQPFTPQYPLWSDGATKRRWIILPPGSFIDARRPDAWEFPPGTRLFKEFAFDRPIETRMLERLADGSWRYVTYVWNEDGTDALLAPAEGIAALARRTAPQGRYAVPSEYDCRACHEGRAVPVLGFTALQLSTARDALAPHAERPPRDALELRTLVARGWLRNLPPALVERPPRIAAASPLERAVLGYLHANCGHCHEDPDAADAAVPVGLVLSQGIGGAAAARKVLQSMIGTPSRFRIASAGAAETPAPPRLVVPGAARASVLAQRMRSRNPRMQMPPLGTALADAQALELIERWIDQELDSPQEPRR